MVGFLTPAAIARLSRPKHGSAFSPEQIELFAHGGVIGVVCGGMKRRVEIARALLHRPRFLVLDEPTVGLDIDSRQDLVDHVHRLCRDENLAVLWATHLIDEIEPGDHVVLLHRGRVRAQGTIDEVVGAAGGVDQRAGSIRDSTGDRSIERHRHAGNT